MPRIKVKEVEPVATTAEFCQKVDEVAKIQVAIEKKTAELKKKHQDVDDKYAGEIQTLERDRDELMKRCEPYFFDHSAELCTKSPREGSTKLARFGVRLGQPTVTKSGKLKKIAWKAIGAILESMENLKKFVRATPEVDKDAILATFRKAQSKDALEATIAKNDVGYLEAAGFGVEQTDQFWVEPIADTQV